MVQIYQMEGGMKMLREVVPSIIKLFSDSFNEMILLR